MFVSSIERSWLLHMCNTLDHDPRWWPEEGGLKRVSWNPWQKAEREVLTHHLHGFEPFSSKSWRRPSALSGKNSETVLHRIFYLWSRYNFDDTLIESVSNLVPFIYHPIILVAYLGIRNIFIPEYSCEGCDQNFKGPGPLSSLPGWLMELVCPSLPQQGLKVWGRFFQVPNFEIMKHYACHALFSPIHKSKSFSCTWCPVSDSDHH